MRLNYMSVNNKHFRKIIVKLHQMITIVNLQINQTLWNLILKNYEKYKNRTFLNAAFAEKLRYPETLSKFSPRQLV
jgi:hypothetical protein